MTNVNQIKKEATEALEIFKQENIEKLAKEVGKSLKVMIHDKQDQLSHIKDQYEENIKQHPFSCVGSAFAAGIIFGLLLRRH